MSFHNFASWVMDLSDNNLWPPKWLHSHARQCFFTLIKIIITEFWHLLKMSFVVSVATAAAVVGSLAACVLQYCQNAPPCWCPQVFGVICLCHTSPHAQHFCRLTSVSAFNEYFTTCGKFAFFVAASLNALSACITGSTARKWFTWLVY